MNHQHRPSEDPPHELADAAKWDERYGQKPEGIWSGNPNPALVAEVEGLTPGRALDVGCGEGADAIWLADRGWIVTGVDLSRVALERAASAAAARGVKVSWQAVDLLAQPPAAGAYDLVTAHYVHLPPAERHRLYASLADAVAENGTLLVVGHHPSFAALAQAHDAGVFFSSGDIAAQLDAQHWEVLVSEERERQHHLAESGTALDSVLVARRRPL